LREAAILFHKDSMHRARQVLIDELKKKGIYSSTLISVMNEIPRHLFVSEALRYRAYDDISLPIGFGQTISKPSVIALMVQALGLNGEERVLEIGTGSGYQSAILGRLASKVITIERIPELSLRARDILVKMQYTNIQFIQSGEFIETEGIFEAIVVAAGANILPVELFSKLAPGGVLVVPVTEGGRHVIMKYVKTRSGQIAEENIGEAVFVPLVR
jgi:protein-L-isoaspartate(D-aspartate) O-methyltransferase